MISTKRGLPDFESLKSRFLLKFYGRIYLNSRCAYKIPLPDETRTVYDSPANNRMADTLRRYQTRDSFDPTAVALR